MSFILQINYLKKRLFFLIINFLLRITVFLSPSNKKNILVFRSAALGDFVISLPALKLLRTRYPNHQIILMTIQSAAKEQRAKVAGYTGSADHMPWLELASHLIDKTIVLSSLALADLWNSIRPLVRDIAPEACFVLTDPSAPGLGVLKKLVMLRLLGVHCPIYGWRDSSSITRLRAEQYKLGLYRHHVLGPISAVFESPDFDKVNTLVVEFDVHIPQKDIAWAEDFWHKQCLKENKVIAIAPGSVQPHKRWPIENFIQICLHLLSEPNAVLIITGTPGDYPIGEKLAALDNTRVINLAGKTSVGQVAAMLQKCELLVGNDGGAMHLGDAVGCRVVSIIPGIEYPNSIEPWHNIEYSVRHSVACAPCYNFVMCPNGHNHCMTQLPVEEVLTKIHLALKQGKKTESSSRRIFQVNRKNREACFQEIINN